MGPCKSYTITLELAPALGSSVQSLMLRPVEVLQHFLSHGGYCD